MINGFHTTGIGSLPHKDPLEACRLILDSVDIPFWPQLPHKSFHELMVAQYSEGFPFVRINGEDIYVEEAVDEDVASFYEAIANGRGFPISEEYAAGLYAFINILREEGRRLNLIKGHVTGPITFTLSLTNTGKRPIFFDEEMRELALELLKGKVRWQIEMLKPYADKVIIFIDEPILSALGSSTYIGVDTQEVSRLLNEIVRHIREAGAISGIHCCSKGDWHLVLSSMPDVLSFDAYYYWDTLSIYPDEFKRFIENNGYIAWGIVPTTGAIRSVTVNGLKEQLERGFSSLKRIGISDERLKRQSLLTPSCGAGSLQEEDAIRVFSLLKELRDNYVRD
ncbi:MAG: hypothetical protein Fur0020_05690 [Thermodesulfovibrionia bacterium]